MKRIALLLSYFFFVFCCIKHYWWMAPCPLYWHCRHNAIIYTMNDATNCNKQRTRHGQCETMNEENETSYRSSCELCLNWILFNATVLCACVRFFPSYCLWLWSYGKSRASFAWQQNLLSFSLFLLKQKRRKREESSNWQLKRNGNNKFFCALYKSTWSMTIKEHFFIHAIRLRCSM